MRVITQSHTILGNPNPMKHIERIARVCYKSEDKIANGTDKKMIKKLYNNGHMAMLEHYRFIMQINQLTYKMIECLELPNFKMTHDRDDRYIISFNARALINMVEDSNSIHHETLPMAVGCLRDELINHIIKKYGCYELFGMSVDDTAIVSTPVEFIENKRSEMTANEFTKHGWMSCMFTTDRGITHELVRHRLSSFAQESTRYCNYGNDGEITFIAPCYWNSDGSDERCLKWLKLMDIAEKGYLDLLKNGASPQEARAVLPHSVKADIIVTANVEEWLHIFELRSVGTTGKPHPMMEALMKPLFGNMVEEWYIKSEDFAKLKIGGDWLYEK